MDKSAAICEVYAHRIDPDSFLYLVERASFPVRLTRSEWRLLMVGVEAPPALALWLETRDYHITTGAALARRAQHDRS